MFKTCKEHVIYYEFVDYQSIVIQWNMLSVNNKQKQALIFISSWLLFSFLQKSFYYFSFWLNLVIFFAIFDWTLST